MLKIDKYAAAIRSNQQEFIKKNHQNHVRTIKLARKLLSKSILDELHLSWFMNASKCGIVVPFSDKYDLEFTVSQYTVDMSTTAGEYFPETVDSLVITLDDLTNRCVKNSQFVLRDKVDVLKAINTRNFRNWVFDHTCFSLIKCTELMSGPIPPPYTE